jgi:hypothetical protein
MLVPRPNISLLTRFLRGFLLLLLVCVGNAFGDLRITEVLPEDRQTLADEDGEYSGWVELLNSGPNSVPLVGYGLSDDPSRPFRWTFPELTLAAGSRLVVFTSGKDRKLLAGPRTNTPTETTPAQLAGLQWWLDAADASSLVIGPAGHVSEWRDQSGRNPRAELPAPQSPAGIPSKILWLDAADPTSLELTNGAVSQWRDRSGASNHVAQPVAERQPTWGYDPEGRPRVSFDGQNDLLAWAGEISLQTLVWVGVESPSAETNSLRPLVGHSSQYDFHRGNQQALLGDYPGMAPGISGAVVYLNGRRVNPRTTALPAGLNVVIIVGSDLGRVENLAADRLLADRNWWGEVFEVVGFERALVESEVLSLDRHLRAKWAGPPEQLPADFSARQSRGEWQPVWVQDPLTGLPAVRFDGVDDRLEFAEVKRAQFLFIVVREDPFATDAFRPFLGHSSSATFSRGSDRLLLYAGSPPTWLEGQPVDPLNTRLPARRTLLSFEFKAGVPFDSLAMDRNADDRVWCGDVLEVVSFDRVLDATERAGIEAYLACKWRLPDRRLHANFSLKREGEAVLLTQPDGTQVDATRAVISRPDQAYGRLADGADWGWFATPTPGAANGSVAVELGLTPPPSFGPAAGFFTGQQAVAITLPTNAPAGTRLFFTLDGSAPRARLATPWLEDEIPPAATVQPVNDEAWAWTRTDPVPASGVKSLRSGTVTGLHQLVLRWPAAALRLGSGGVLTAELWCDPAQPPRAVMLQFRAGDSWEHRAFWGEDLIPLGELGTPGRWRAGELPAPGSWARLEVPLGLLGLAQAEITGLALTLFDGRAAFDSVGYSEAPLPRPYQEPLRLTNSTVVRALAVAPGHLESSVVTASFLTVPAVGLPVVSLSTDPDHLFAEDAGIYVAGPEQNAAGLPRIPNYQRNWERPVHAELFEPDGAPGFSVAGGLKIHGGFTRHWPQRSLRLHFRERYGPAEVDYPVFPGNPVNRFENLILRNSGNDWNRAFLRDYLAHSFAADLGLGHQAWRPAQVFINGEYWGVLTLREQANADTIARQHGVPAKQLDVIKNETEVIAGDLVDYLSLEQSAITALGDLTAQPALAARINLPNYQDWLAVEFFSGNDDWPGNNVLAWHPRSPTGQWNWMLLDCDGGFDWAQVNNNTLNSALLDQAVAGTASRSLVLMRGLLGGQAYRQALALRFGDLLNTTFSPAHTGPRLDQLESNLAPAMPGQIARWKDSVSLTPPLQDLAAWRVAVGEVRNYLNHRPAVFRQQVRDFFQLGPDVALTVQADAPERLQRIGVGTLVLAPEQLPWHGTYFSGLPVPLTVTAKPGFKVVGWSDGAAAGATRVVTPLEAATLTVLLGPDEAKEPEELLPAPHVLVLGDYRFEAWPTNSAAGEYPPAMVFETSLTPDPEVSAVISGRWTNRYDLPARSRVAALGDAGVSFVNTGNSQPGEGYVTGALLALNTVGFSQVQVTWNAGTVAANVRPYALRLQWRVGAEGAFTDVLDAAGEPVEYERQSVAGETQTIGPHPLPAAAAGQPLVQLRWRYHALPTGEDSGARAHLRLDDILVSGVRQAAGPATLELTPGAGQFRLTGRMEPGATGTLRASFDLKAWTDLETRQAGADGRLEFPALPDAETVRFFQLSLP